MGVKCLEVGGEGKERDEEGDADEKGGSRFEILLKQRNREIN